MCRSDSAWAKELHRSSSNRCQGVRAAAAASLIVACQSHPPYTGAMAANNSGWCEPITHVPSPPIE